LARALRHLGLASTDDDRRRFAMLGNDPADVVSKFGHEQVPLPAVGTPHDELAVQCCDTRRHEY
jgi:hypothetical protein